VSEEVKKKGLFARLFKGSVYEEDPVEEGEEGAHDAADANKSQTPTQEAQPTADDTAQTPVEAGAKEAAREEAPVAEVAAAKVLRTEQTEKSEEISKADDVVTEPSQEASEEQSQEAVQKQPQEAAEKPSGEVPEELPQELAQEASQDVPAEPSEEERKKGLFGRLRRGLSKTRGSLAGKIDRALFGKKVVDEETLEELEEALITADIGVNTTMRLVAEVAERVSRKELTDPEALRQHLKKRIGEILIEDEGHFTLGETRPYVVLVIGVNGVGKTTTIAKIAARHVSEGHKVIIGAADTFRAAAIEQLCIWGERVGAKVVHHQHGSDPAAVAYDTLEAAKARGADLVLIDTAGRLHTKTNLMEEIKKIRRVVGNSVEGAPHEVMLVLDSTTGQNAINQAIQFRDTVGVDSIALTKLDGTAKGGVIVGICDELKIPVKFIGIGEQVDDLRPFEATQFIEALF
jgi:fused signal recognition particle receptor